MSVSKKYIYIFDADSNSRHLKAKTHALMHSRDCLLVLGQRLYFWCSVIMNIACEMLSSSDSLCCERFE